MQASAAAPTPPPSAPSAPAPESRRALEPYVAGLIARLTEAEEPGDPWPLEAELPDGPGKLLPWLASAPPAVLLGPPGAGKSASLRHLALQQARAWQDGRGRLPILVDLAAGHPWEGVEDLALRCLGLPQDGGPRLADLGPTVLLLDNLHLSPNLYLFEGLEMLFRAGGQAGPGLVVACRTADWPHFRAWFQGIEELTLRPLDRGRLEALLREALPAEKLAVLRDWLARDPDLAQAVRLPLGLKALLETLHDAEPAAWRRSKVLDSLLHLLLESQARPERAAFRSALVDVALQGLGQGALIQVDTVVMSLAVSRERMVRSGAVVPHGTALAFVEPLLATHLAASALAARAEQGPAALLEQLGPLDPARRAALLAAILDQVSDPAELLALALDGVEGPDLVARCLSIPLCALPDAPRGALGLVESLLGPERGLPGGSLRSLADAMVGRAALAPLVRRLRLAAGRDEEPAPTGPAAEGQLPGAPAPAEDTEPAAMEAALRRWADAFVAARARGLGLKQRADWQGAASALVEAGQALDRLEADLSFQRGQLAAAGGDHEAARAAFEAALARDPQEARYLAHYGRALIALDRAGEAIGALSEAGDAADQHAEVQAALAEAYRAQGWIEEAGRAFARAAELAPEQAGYAYSGAELLAESGDLAAAEQGLTRALARRPHEAAWHDALGQVLAELGRGEGALRAFQRAHELAPAEPRYLRRLGRAQLALGRYPEALASLEAARDADPGAPGPLADLGLAQAAAGRTMEAVDSLRRAVALDGIWPLDHLSLARVLRDAGRLDEAAASLDEAERRAPASALVAAEAQALRLALAADEAAPLPAAPDPVTPPMAGATGTGAASSAADPLAAARAALAAGDSDEAIALAQALLATDPGQAEACAFLGQAYRQLGLAEAAMTAWEEALRLAPSVDRYRLGLAEAAMAAGHSQLAQRVVAAADPSAAPASESAAPASAAAPIDASGSGGPGLPGDAALSADLAMAVKGWTLDLALPRLAPALPADLDAEALLARLRIAAEGEAAAGAARRALVQVLGRVGRIDEALAAAEAAADQDPDPEALVLLAWARLLQGDAMAALESLGMARALGATAPHLDVLEGRAQLQRGDAAAAEAALSRALAQGVDEGDLQALRAQAAFQRGDTGTAIRALDRAIARSPRRPELQAQLGDVLSATGQDEQAAERYAQAALLDPDRPEYRVSQAEALSRDGDGATARLLLSQVLERRPQHLGAALLLARIDLNEGRVAEARGLLARSLDRHPDSAALHQGLGLAARAAGDLEQARGHLEEAARLDQSRAETYQALGEVCLRLGEVDEALQALENAVHLDGEDLEARLALAEACDQAGLPARAREQLDAARSLAPRDARPLLAAGRLALAAQQPEEAVAALEAARERDGQNPEVFHQLGLAYKLLREYEQATQMFRTALRLAPMSPKAYAQYAAVSAMHFVNRVVAIEDAPAGAEAAR